MVFGWKKGSEDTSKKREVSVENNAIIAQKPASTPFSTVVANSSVEDNRDETSSSSEDNIHLKHGKVRSALGPGTVIQGKLSFDTPVRIDGKLSGEIFSTKSLIIGKTGQIDARVEVASLIVYGTVRGNIKATERVEIYEGGSVEGQVESVLLMVESGSRLHGDCNMGVKNTSSVISATSTKLEHPTQKTDTAIIANPSLANSPLDLESIIGNSSTANPSIAGTNIASTNIVSSKSKESKTAAAAIVTK